MKIQHWNEPSNNNLNKIDKQLLKTWSEFLDHERSTYLRYPAQAQDDLNKIHALVKKKNHFKNLVLIGIGGSSLGTEMLYHALVNKVECKKDFYVLDNTDSELVFEVMSNIDLKDSLFYVVSKSGSTAETMAAFSIIDQHFNKMEPSFDKRKEHYVFCTDPKSSQLLDFANKHHIECLHIPSMIGGRFSVLSPSSLFCAGFLGIDIDTIIQSAKDFGELLSQPDSQQCQEFIALCEDWINLHHKGLDHVVMMPYSSKLRSFSKWFVQLWAESLGKIDRQGQSVGSTPIEAHGATDQHSQMQLFMQGPKDKIMCFIKVEKPKHNYALKSDIEIDSIQKLAPFSLNELIHAQLNGTITALQEMDRPVTLLTLSELNESELAQLITLFMSMTSLVGLSLNVDPFDQPGVELGKKYAYDYLIKERQG